MGKKNPELYLPKDGEVLTLRTCDCDLLLEVDFTDDQDKTRSLEWAPIPYDWCPCQKGRSGHTGREHHVKLKAEIRVLHPRAEERQRLPRTREARREA